MKQRLSFLLATLSIVVLTVGVLPAQAQRTSGSVGLGGQLGDPSGVSLKFYSANNPSYDFLAAWDLTADFLFLNGHALFENNIESSNMDPDLHWIIGPGGFVGFYDTVGNDEAVLGLSGTIGLNMVFNNQIELYGRFTPRINLTPDTDGGIGGGVGLRYYF